MKSIQMVLILQYTYKHCVYIHKDSQLSLFNKDALPPFHIN